MSFGPLDTSAFRAPAFRSESSNVSTIENGANPFEADDPGPIRNTHHFARPRGVSIDLNFPHDIDNLINYFGSLHSANRPVPLK
jgi:hypothetical protein